jgi:hypothetical protein
VNIMSSRNHFFVPLLLGFAMTVGACGDDDDDDEQDYQVQSDIEVNPDVDFSKYTSFDIVDPAPNATGDPPAEFVEAQAELEKAIVAELEDHGLRRDPNSPQLLVNPLVSTKRATGARQFYEAYYGWYWGYEYLWTLEYDYIDGSLVIDVVDRGDPEDVGDDLLVYRGAVYGMMSEEIDVIKLQIRNATQAIFAEWP